MVKKKTRAVEDRQRLIVDRSDGTSFADFDCIYMPKTPGKFDKIYDKVGCVFATNGPYIYKVVYERNQYAGLIFKNRFRYEIFEDFYPIKTTLNLKYIAVIAKRASNASAAVLIYRDQNLRGSRYLYGGINLEQLSSYPADIMEMALTDDDKLLITINNEESLVFSIQLSDMTITVKSKSKLDDLNKQFFLFNEGMNYPKSYVPLKYVFVHLSNQRAEQTELGGSLAGWIVLLLFLVGTLVLAWFIRKDIKKSEQKVRDSGIGHDDEPTEEKASLSFDDSFNYNDSINQTMNPDSVGSDDED
jgi:hypothetical protein